jgi:cytosine/adenosine deaminase-related metal-dependent hydrolase
MSTLLIKNIDMLVTMNPTREEIADAAILVEDNRIIWLGSTAALDPWLQQQGPALAGVEFDQVIDAAGTIVTPGLVNCHHHMWQSLTRGIATGTGKKLFDWISMLFPIWAELRPEGAYTSAKLVLAEMVLSGCTTVSNMLYLYPNGVRIDDEIRAAREAGVRFHPNRGSLTLPESEGGNVPERLCEKEEDVLKACIEAIETYHDPEPYAMLRIGVAPNMPNSVTPDLMRESARLAETYPKVKLHTHTSETMDDVRYTMANYGKTPVEYCEWVGWQGEHVWYAHAVQVNDAEVDWLARTNTGVCHCPSSNMILASGIAPIRPMVDKKVRVGVGVDGSSSNDCNNLLAEARLAMLLQRVGYPGFESSGDRFTAREALELATLGGARVLGQETIGWLAPGQAADFVAYRMDDIFHAGGLGDRVSSLVTCHPTNVWLSVINGRVVVENGEFLPYDLEPVIAEHNRISRWMMSQAGVA